MFEWKISRTHNTAVDLRDPKDDAKELNPKIESSSCRCFATSIGDKQDTKKFVFRILQKLQCNGRKMKRNAHLQVKRIVESRY